MPRDDEQALDELTALADELLEQATEIRRQWAELGETLGLDAPPPAEADPAPADDQDMVRLVALDMVLDGHSREEVRDHLAATFGQDDREHVLDEVFSQYG